MEKPSHHKPVMVDEVGGFLHPEKGYKVLDATVGCGGHASSILEKIEPHGFLIGVDRDQKALHIAKKHLKKFSGIYKLIHANFRDIDVILKNLGIEKINAALFDLGISSYQIEDEMRGFSFRQDAFLDMRMDQSPGSGLRAYDLVNKLKKDELERIIRELGQERYFRRIVGAILEQRKKKPINSTKELSELIKKALGGRYRSRRIHPATRTFQGLRIAVNNELENIDEGLCKVLNFLSPGARMCVISFHSLEDRIVKTRFKEFKAEGKGLIVTKKPVTPKDEEINENPRSRSAKLRVFEKINDYTD